MEALSLSVGAAVLFACAGCITCSKRLQRRRDVLFREMMDEAVAIPSVRGSAKSMSAQSRHDASASSRKVAEIELDVMAGSTLIPSQEQRARHEDPVADGAINSCEEPERKERYYEEDELTRGDVVYYQHGGTDWILVKVLTVDARGAGEEGGTTYVIGGAPQLRGAEIETVRRRLWRSMPVWTPAGYWKKTHPGV